MLGFELNDELMKQTKRVRGQMARFLEKKMIAEKEMRDSSSVFPKRVTDKNKKKSKGERIEKLMNKGWARSESKESINP